MSRVKRSQSNPIKAIRRHCLACSGGSTIAVAECPSAVCALWPFRMGKNPYRHPASEKQKASARQNLSAARAGRKER